jgi:F0F1-type ATP synthase assembly protein I
MTDPAHNKDGQQQKRQQARAYMKYTGMAFQMGAIILVGTLIGQKLDSHYQMERPYLTVLFALLSIFAALYVTLKDLFAQK